MTYNLLRKCSVGLAALALSCSGAVEIEVDPTCNRLIEGGHLQLDRTKYFGICRGAAGFMEKVPVEGGAEYLLDDLNIAFGRTSEVCKQFSQAHKWSKTPGVQEDEDRPGYADPATVKSTAIDLKLDEPDAMQHRADRIRTIDDGFHAALPDFMEKYRIDKVKETLPANLDAATEYAVECLKAIPAWKRPAFMQPMNEPKYQMISDPHFQQWHVMLKEKVHAEVPGVMVGGPCQSVAYYYKNNYAPFTGMMKPFMDGTQGNLDFYGFHPYDYFSGDVEDLSSGLPMESVLDLLDNYSRITFRKPVKLALSEGGATGKNFYTLFDPARTTEASQAVLDAVGSVEDGYDYLAMLNNRSLNRFTMTWLDRPQTILTHVPFVLVSSEWNEKYPWVLYRREGQVKSGKHQPTANFDFYKLWKDVKGRRVHVRSGSPDVQAQAFVDGSTLYLCLNNLSDDRQELNLQFSARPERISTVRYSRNGYFGKLSEKKFKKLPSGLVLEGDEFMIITMTYNQPIVPEKTVDEQLVYGDRVVEPIRANTPLNYQLNVEQADSVTYATLRIGFSRQLKAEKTPIVLFNGKRLTVPMERAWEKRKQVKDYVSLKMIQIPPSLIRAENRVEIRFPDEGGSVGSVALRIGTEDVDARPVYDVRDFGAKGDGVSLDTKAIQKAIDAADPEGAVVRVSKGSYVVGTIKLKSNLEFHLAEGAELLGSTNILDYAKDVQVAIEAPSFSKCVIYAEDCENVSLTGTGEVNGRASWSYFSGKNGRPMLMRFVNCRNLTLNDVMLRNAGSWCTHMVNCDDVVVDRVRMHTRLLKNNDGFDLDGCRNVLIQNCDLVTGDDTICPKSTSKRLTENVTVRNCRISSHTAAFKCGTSSHGGFKNISFTDCEIYDCRMGVIKLLMVDGGTMENITVSDLTMTNVEGPLFIRLGNRGRSYHKATEQIYSANATSEGAAVGRIRNICIRNITATVTGDDKTRQGIMITGIPGHKIENVVLENIQIEFTGNGTEEDAANVVLEDEARYPEQHFFGVLPSWGMYARHVDGLTLKNVDLSVRNADQRRKFVCVDVSNCTGDLNP
ncbi:glycosyl hydrolase family 28 protein [Pontiella agarivorans]|uniref:Glycosyl hydrolase family 28 protein n=1 Tax=Pontiella agarivorans TaxID=3038953 RepID=A0ABU5MY76_9BACT|nr:glycosyl hydrolase family 28 protein [Pontiella agarivorans]MDZ8119132.1 glycosyl hydrolase family 28 protein [Pontiella agarivorans]